MSPNYQARSPFVLKHTTSSMYMSNMALNDVNEEESLFKLVMDDVAKNQQLKQSIVPFECLKIEDKIGQGNITTIMIMLFIRKNIFIGSFRKVFSGIYCAENSEEFVKVAVKTIKSK